MNLPTMRGLVRRDLKDEDPSNYRFTDSEIDRAISRVVLEFSNHAPREMKSTLATSSGSRNLDISSLTDRVSIDAVEYPVDKAPKHFRKFYVYQDILTILEPFAPWLRDTIPDGSNCYVYWGKTHTLGITTSTIPPQFNDLIALGACGYAILSLSQYSTEAISIGGRDTDRDYSFWGRDRLRQFQQELNRLSRHRKLKIGRLYE